MKPGVEDKTSPLSPMTATWFPDRRSLQSPDARHRARRWSERPWALQNSTRHSLPTTIFSTLACTVMRSKPTKTRMRKLRGPKGARVVPLSSSSAARRDRGCQDPDRRNRRSKHCQTCARRRHWPEHSRQVFAEHNKSLSARKAFANLFVNCDVDE